MQRTRVRQCQAQYYAYIGSWPLGPDLPATTVSSLGNWLTRAFVETFPVTVMPTRIYVTAPKTLINMGRSRVFLDEPHVRSNHFYARAGRVACQSAGTHEDCMNSAPGPMTLERPLSTTGSFPSLGIIVSSELHGRHQRTPSDPFV